MRAWKSFSGSGFVDHHCDSTSDVVMGTFSASRGNQRPSGAIKGDQGRSTEIAPSRARPTEIPHLTCSPAIRHTHESLLVHQRPSEAIRGHHLAALGEAIRGHQRLSEAITSRLLARQRVRICSPNELPIDVCRFVNSRLSRAIGLSSTDTAPLAVRGCNAIIAVCTQRASGEDQIAPTCGERIGGRRDEHLHAGLHTAGEWRRPDRAHLRPSAVISGHQGSSG